MGQKLGQHFLTNKDKIRKIIDALNLKKGDKVLEIGPGKGALTKELGKEVEGLDILAIEMDPNLVDYLENHLVPKIKEAGSTLTVKKDNILTKLPSLSEEIENFEEYKIIGNIPYYITGKLFRVFEELNKKPQIIVLTIQKEVADRLVAEPPNSNILSSSVQFWSDVEKLFNIPKKDFDPAPDVDSAVVVLKPKEYNKEIKDSYYKTMKMVFKHPRKTILNNLSLGSDKNKGDLRSILENTSINPGDRPQNLNVEDLIELSKSLTESN